MIEIYVWPKSSAISSKIKIHTSRTEMAPLQEIFANYDPDPDQFLERVQMCLKDLAPDIYAFYRIWISIV